MSRRIVIFDMDGTLVDSALDITTAINLVRDDIELKPLEVSTVVEAINGNHHGLAEIFYGTKEYQQEHRELFETYYHAECVKNVYLYDGVLNLLNTLNKNNIKCSVATNAPATFARRILDHVEISHYFDYIYGADSYKSKPHPDMLNTILSNYSYDNKQDLLPLMIGDSVKDIEAGHNAKIQTIHVKWGFSDEQFENSIKHPKELLEVLDIN